MSDDEDVAAATEAAVAAAAEAALARLQEEEGVGRQEVDREDHSVFGSSNAASSATGDDRWELADGVVAQDQFAACVDSDDEERVPLEDLRRRRRRWSSDGGRSRPLHQRLVGVREEELAVEDHESSGAEEQAQQARVATATRRLNEIQYRLSKPLTELLLGAEWATTEDLNVRMTRPEVVKRVYAYGKEHGLEDPDDARVWILDGPMRKVFRYRRTTLFRLHQLLAPHLQQPLDTAPAPTARVVRVEPHVGGRRTAQLGQLRLEKQGRQPAPIAAETAAAAAAASSMNAGRKRRRVADRGSEMTSKRGGGGRVALSAQLSAFLEGHPKEADRSDILRQLHSYIVAQQLQDPNARSHIVLDDALKTIFGVEKMTYFSMQNLLNNHLRPLPPEGWEPANVQVHAHACERYAVGSTRSSSSSTNSSSSHSSSSRGGA